MSIEHPASFRRYLKERFVNRLPRPIGEFQDVDGDLHARPGEDAERFVRLPVADGLARGGDMPETISERLTRFAINRGSIRDGFRGR